MRAILDHCTGMPLEDVADGTVVLAEGQNTGNAYVLVQGRVEVLRGDVQVAVCDEPGALFGEMSILLGCPHTATVRALGDARLYVIEDGRTFFRNTPDLLWSVGHLLANRLNAATSYLADLKHQYAEHGTHLEMVGEVLEALLYEQERDFRPGSARDPGRA
jgi:CRP/FNR family transcriptional regulator, cyclic AMP receptor protein